MTHQTRPRIVRLPYTALEAIEPNQTQLAAIAGVNRRTITRWTHDGVPADKADNIAVALGLHPLEVWPEWDGILRVREACCHECGTTITWPVAWGYKPKKFCSRPCQLRRNRRDAYGTWPEERRVAYRARVQAYKREVRAAAAARRA